MANNPHFYPSHVARNDGTATYYVPSGGYRSEEPWGMGYGQSENVTMPFAGQPQRSVVSAYGPQRQAFGQYTVMHPGMVPQQAQAYHPSSAVQHYPNQSWTPPMTPHTMVVPPQLSPSMSSTPQSLSPGQPQIAVPLSAENIGPPPGTAWKHEDDQMLMEAIFNWLSIQKMPVQPSSAKQDWVQAMWRHCEDQFSNHARKWGAKSCQSRLQRLHSCGRESNTGPKKPNRWSAADDAMLKHERKLGTKFAEIGKKMVPPRTHEAVRRRHSNLMVLEYFDAADLARLDWIMAHAIAEHFFKVQS